jgi:hypothetical protein
MTPNGSEHCGSQKRPGSCSWTSPPGWRWPGPSPGKVAGVDPGIVHPLAIATADQALLVSGRAVRAEEFLHLEDQKARQKKMATKRGPLRAKAGQARRTGSRRWKQLARSQRRAEARDRRVVRLVFGLPGLRRAKKGRRLVCTVQTCNKSHHRDVAGAQNMVTKLGHAPPEIARTEHRRVGSPARRDRGSSWLKSTPQLLGVVEAGISKRAEGVDEDPRQGHIAHGQAGKAPFLGAASGTGGDEHHPHSDQAGDVAARVRASEAARLGSWRRACAAVWSASMLTTDTHTHTEKVAAAES